MNTITKCIIDGVDYCFTDTNLKNVVDKNNDLIKIDMSNNVSLLKKYIGNRLSIVQNELDNYTTNDDVDNKIAAALEEGTFATTEYVDGQVEGLASTQYVDGQVEGLASTQYVDDAIDAIELLEGPQGPQGEKGDKGDKGDTGATPDLTGYATTDYVDGKVEGLASTQYVDNLVGQIASQLDEINGEEI